MSKLLSMGYELCLAGQYDQGAVSIRGATRGMDVSLSEAIDRLRQLGVSHNVSADDTLQSLRSLSH